MFLLFTEVLSGLFFLLVALEYLTFSLPRVEGALIKFPSIVCAVSNLTLRNLQLLNGLQSLKKENKA